MQEKRNNAENKILILYALVQAPYALTKHDLSMIMMDNLLMSYYNFQDSYYGLRDGRFIISEKQGADEFIEITDSGRSMLELFSPNLDVHKRSMIDVALEEMKNELLDRNTLTSRCYPLDNGAQMVEIQAKEGRRTYFSLSIEVDNEKDAQAIVNYWNKNPKSIHYQFLSLLTGDRSLED